MTARYASPNSASSCKPAFARKARSARCPLPSRRTAIPVIALTGRPALAARREAIEQQVYALRGKKLLHGADAARILDYIHRTGANPAVIQALHDAREDDGEFLRILHRLPEFPEVQVRAAASPVGPTRPDKTARIDRPTDVGATGRAAKVILAPDRAGKRAIALIAVAASLVFGAAWILWPPNRAKPPEGPKPELVQPPLPKTARSDPGSPKNESNRPGIQLVGPPQSLVTGSTQLLVNPTNNK